MNSARIDIALGFDAAYAPHAGALIASLTRAAPGARFRFIVLHEGVSADAQARLQSIAPNSEFFWVELRADDVPEYAARDHFSRAILHRLGLEARAPEDCARVLYLDADVIVLGDVRELWATDLGGAALGAVVDCEGDVAAFAQRWGLSLSDNGYFNSGVLLIDLQQVRARRLFSAAIEFVVAHGAELRYADQDALNHVFWNAWRALPPAWNAQKLMVLEAKAQALPAELRFHDRLPYLVHFTGREKPWTRESYHPWAWLYWDALSRTPFNQNALSVMNPIERARMWLRWMRRRPASGWHEQSRGGDHAPIPYR